MPQNEMENPIRPGKLCRIIRDLRAGSFEQLAVLHTGGTGSFTSSAAETSVDMSFKRQRIRFQPAFRDRAHQIDPAARPIIFVGCHNVSRTSF
jgi:hypothetical protein